MPMGMTVPDDHLVERVYKRHRIWPLPFVLQHHVTEPGADTTGYRKVADLAHIRASVWWPWPFHWAGIWLRRFLWWAVRWDWKWHLWRGNEPGPGEIDPCWRSRVMVWLYERPFEPQRSMTTTVEYRRIYQWPHEWDEDHA